MAYRRRINNHNQIKLMTNLVGAVLAEDNPTPSCSVNYKRSFSEKCFSIRKIFAGIISNPVK